jgi:hypothetical protein
MSKKKAEVIYRIIEHYGEYHVQFYTPAVHFLWIFKTKDERWDSVEVYDTEQDAMACIRRLQKYSSPKVIWQSNVDELDLAEALADE